jgi:hypothetical protein
VSVSRHLLVYEFVHFIKLKHLIFSNSRVQHGACHFLRGGATYSSNRATHRMAPRDHGPFPIQKEKTKTAPSSMVLAPSGAPYSLSLCAACSSRPSKQLSSPRPAAQPYMPTLPFAFSTQLARSPLPPCTRISKHTAKLSSSAG